MEGETSSQEKYLVEIAERMGKCIASERISPEREQWYYGYAGALAQVFDVDPLLVAQLVNLDYLSVPYVDEDTPLPCYAQLLTMTTTGRDSIGELLAYVTDYRDEAWREPYQHSSFDKARLRLTIAHIAKTYTSANAYFATVSERMWRRRDYLETRYEHYLVLLQKRIDAFLHYGTGYVFDRIEDNRVYFTM